MRLTITTRAEDFIGARVNGATPDDAARLISAAPELLAALQWAAARVQVLNDEGNPALSAWLPEARKAIATATKEA